MIIIYDKRLPSEYLTALNSKLPEVSFVPFNGESIPTGLRVYDSILFHPDMYFFQFDDKTVVHSPDIPEDIIECLRSEGVTLIKGEKSPQRVYPDTARYNAVILGNILLHDPEYTDPGILREAEKRDVKIVKVSQGYTRCSTLVADDNAVITSDKGIALSLEKEGVDVLVISEGNIDLPGEKYGFIGGASGRIFGEGTIILGNPAFHPDYSKITEFFTKHNTGFTRLEGLPLYDAGTLLVIGQ